MALTRLNTNAFGTSVNLTSNVTGTLPTANGGTGATSFTAGITGADIWRINANFDLPNSTTTISSGWERSDESAYAKIGTGMTESSGIFTFPGTGIWNVRFVAQSYSTNYAATNATAYIYSTTNNSTYQEEARAWLGYEAAGGNPPSRCNSNCETTIDVTDTSNVKVKFMGVDNDNTDFGLEGSTNANVTHAIFTRLGDT